MMLKVLLIFTDTMIDEITITNAGFVNPIRILSGMAPIDNWVTVLIGENGAKKSFLLRSLCEAALGRRTYRPGRKVGSVGISIGETGIPHRVIAISNTPLDRFPRSGTTNITSRKVRVRRTNFVYLGQRAANGMAGVAQSERSLVGSLISNRARIRSSGKILTEIFSQLGLKPYVAVKLKLVDTSPVGYLTKNSNVPAFKRGLMTALVSLAEQIESEDTFGALRSLEIRQFVVKLSSSLEVRRVREQLLEIMNPGVRLRITAQSASASSNTLNISEWEALMRIGAVEVDGVSFMRLGANSDKRPRIEGEQLSSGQWNWIANFVALAVELRDESLILVDEPENSLHPAWQREFVPTIEKIVSAFHRCQVIIATHSPLIASGISAQNGNIRSLKKTSNELGEVIVESCAERTTYGWAANDVYGNSFNISTTRAGDFIARANKALDMIRRGKLPDGPEIDEFVTGLQMDRIGLPALDPMRVILDDILASIAAYKPGPTIG